MPSPTVGEKILALLSDGQPHSKEEIHATCLYDELAEISTVYVQISYLQRKLRPSGHAIMMEKLHGTAHYRIVRLLSSPYDGRT